MIKINAPVNPEPTPKVAPKVVTPPSVAEDMAAQVTSHVFEEDLEATLSSTTPQKDFDFNEAEHTPALWIIKPLKGDRIEAMHTVTGRVFVGTVQEFNVKLRK